MKLDLSCPIELRGYTLSYVENAIHASVRLYNLSSRRIAAFECIVKWHSRSSGRSIAAPLRMDSLRVKGESAFCVPLSTHRLPDADALELLFTSVRFEDGFDDWHAGNGMIAEIHPLEPISPTDLSALQSLAGADAVCFPKQDSQTWRCVCGRVNSNADPLCARCHRDHLCAISYTPDRICREQVDPSNCASDSDPALSQLQRRDIRRHTARFRGTLAVLVAALALTALLVLQSKPIDAANAEIVGIYGQNHTAHQEELP